MDTKTGLIITGAFVLGVGAGFTVGYLMTKKSCEQHTQEAIDEMKIAHKKELEDIKKENANEEKEEKPEEEFIYNDKPPITEIAGIINSNTDISDTHTKYDFVKLKESIKKETTEKVKSEQSIIDYNTYIQLANDGYLETQFNFDADTETWTDWNNTEYDAEDLPFDAGTIVWDDNEQCYIAERSNKSIYILEKV